MELNRQQSQFLATLMKLSLIGMAVIVGIFLVVCYFVGLDHLYDSSRVVFDWIIFIPLLVTFVAFVLGAVEFIYRNKVRKPMIVSQIQEYRWVTLRSSFYVALTLILTKMLCGILTTVF